MKILRVIGLALAVSLFKFLLMRGVFGAFESALVSFFDAFKAIMDTANQATSLTSFN